jgi:hypothetical protein
MYLLAQVCVHRAHKPLQLPNGFMTLDDVDLVMPDNERQRDMQEYGKATSQGYQYLYQWIIPPRVRVRTHLANNTVAAFARGVKVKDLPSPLLLDYHYGASAVAHWGRQHQKLGKPTQIPEQAAPAPMGPPTKTRTTSVRQQLADKRERSRGDQEAGQPPPRRSRRHLEAESSEPGPEPYTPQEQHILSSGPGYVVRGFTAEEAEEMVLGFWMSTPEAQAEQEREEIEKASSIEKWRKGVS